MNKGYNFCEGGIYRISVKSSDEPKRHITSPRCSKQKRTTVSRRTKKIYAGTRRPLETKVVLWEERARPASQESPRTVIANQAGAAREVQYHQVVGAYLPAWVRHPAVKAAPPTSLRRQEVHVLCQLLPTPQEYLLQEGSARPIPRPPQQRQLVSVRPRLVEMFSKKKTHCPWPSTYQAPAACAH